MKYANFTFKKTAGIAFILVLLGTVVSATAIAWGKAIGTFTIPNVELAMANGFVAWRDRIDYNRQFGVPASGDKIHDFLALIGLASPAPPQAQGAASGTVGSGIAQTIPVLLYHGVATLSDTSEVAPIDAFRTQMFALKRAGWQTVNIEDFLAAMQGKKTLPQKSFLLTFDDGRQDALMNATPILQSIGYQAVMYIITGHSLAPGNEKSKYYATKDQLEQALASGVWELQAHSDIGHAEYPIDASGTLGDFYGHKLWLPAQDPGETSSSYEARVYEDFLTYYHQGKLWPLEPGREESKPEYETRIATDLLNAKTDIESKLGVNVVSFSYPYNDFAKDLETDLANGAPGLIYFVNQIYPISFFQWYPSLGFSQDYPGAEGQLLRRIEPKPDWTPEYLLSFLADGEPKSLPYALPKDMPDDSWRHSWGNIETSAGTIALSAKPTTAGAATVLDGSRMWKNYTLDVHFDWQNSDSVSLFTNYEADPIVVNYLACNFGNTGAVRLEDHENGTIKILAEGHDPSIAAGTGKDAGVRLAPGYAECLWNGAAVTGANIPSSAPVSGGAGIEIWSHDLGTANIAVTDVSATQE